MNNEIGRKITSLTLMTIMLAGGMVIAAPSMMPAAHAVNANLFVSAENSQFNNYFGGPQVIEIVVNDSDLRDTDQLVGEPDVTLNGKIVRMVQATDGLWYAYIADRAQAQDADQTIVDGGVQGNGLDFGEFCASTTDPSAGAGAASVTPNLSTESGSGVTMSDTVGYAIAKNAGAVNAATNGQANLAQCVNEVALGDPTINNVVRESKTPSNPVAATADDVGQIGININSWPFIQLYDLNPTGNVVVQYNKGGNPQTVSLTFDTLDGTLAASTDRSFYPQGSAFHATLTDQALNIDPTDEDSWTFNTAAANPSIFYQFFDESGNGAGGCGNNTPVCAAGGAVTNVTPDLSGNLADFLFEDGGVLIINPDAQSIGTNVVAFQDNADQQFTAFTGVATFSAPVTITELGPNSGVFANYDESDVSNIFITAGALRGTSATVTWDDTGNSVLVGNDFATLDIQPLDDEWNSGEEIPVVLVDQDLNLNTRFDEDLDLNSVTVTLVPSLQIGSPVTLTTGATVDSIALDGNAPDLFSQIGRVDISAGGAAGDGTITIGEIGTIAAVGGIPGGYTAGGETLTLTGGTSTTATATLVWVDNGANGGTANDSIIDIGEIHNIAAVTGIATGYTAGGETLTLTGQTSAAAGTTLAWTDTSVNTIIRVDTGVDVKDLSAIVDETNAGVFEFINYDIRSLGAGTTVTGIVVFSATATQTADGTGTTMMGTAIGAQGLQGTVRLDILDATLSTTSTDNVVVEFTLTGAQTAGNNLPFVVDFFSFGEGATDSDRVNNAIYRFELEESGDNTAEFVGSVEYIMLNQLNIKDPATYNGIAAIADDPTIIVHEDFTDEDSVRINYLDLGADGVATQIADQEEAPTHSGVVSFDSNSYKVADTVVITVEDADLNVDSDLIEIYTSLIATDTVSTAVAVAAGQPQLIDVTFDDVLWQDKVAAVPAIAGATCTDDALAASGFTLVETGTASGVFVGSFQIPATYCNSNTSSASVTGTDIEVNYFDYRDASGETIEVGAGAGVRANTGTVSLDRTVYPVPWGDIGNFAVENSKNTPNGRSVFALHATAIAGALDTTVTETLGSGDLTIHVRVNDPDFDISGVGEDTIATDVNVGNTKGPVKISVSRGSDTVVLAYAGGATADAGTIDTDNTGLGGVRDIGPITEIAPDAGIFELDFTIKYTDGPASTTCPTTTVFTAADGTAGIAQINRFDTAATTSGGFCILQGDIITVEYNDPTDASGDTNTVTDSATFDLRNGVLQSDKSVYIIGGDLILTLIEPDFDLDNDGAETYDLDLVEWDSDAATTTMGDQGGATNAAAFDPEPSAFRETGDSTGIFQIVIEIPESLNNDNLERGEEIVLEYTDWGPSGSDFVGQEDEDINLTIFTSNFGATVELDQKVYTWTDKVYVTVVAPDHNFDGDLIDEIGNSTSDPLKISTRGNDLDNYKLVETGTDTGIFTGEVILTGFTHDADGDGTTGTNGNDVVARAVSGTGPTDGLIGTDDDDGLTVSFEFSEDETVVGSALIRWNIGEIQWLEASYPASGTGVVRIIDPDMNLNPESVNNFDVDVWSDSDAGGIDLTVTETNEATGIFEGTVFFTTTDESSGHRLRVAEGDTVTAEYEDNTLPDPYTTADELDITATTLIGTVVPPLERAPAANLRTVDAFGNSLDAVSVDQQVQVSADLANGQDREQSFAYLVQIQDGNGVTVSLAWITGSLASGQSFSPALSWIPTEAGTYTATAFVWESVDNPTALSPPVSTTVNVR